VTLVVNKSSGAFWLDDGSKALEAPARACPKPWDGAAWVWESDEAALVFLAAMGWEPCSAPRRDRSGPADLWRTGLRHCSCQASDACLAVTDPARSPGEPLMWKLLPQGPWTAFSTFHAGDDWEVCDALGRQGLEVAACAMVPAGEDACRWARCRLLARAGSPDPFFALRRSKGSGWKFGRASELGFWWAAGDSEEELPSAQEVLLRAAAMGLVPDGRPAKAAGGVAAVRFREEG